MKMLPGGSVPALTWPAAVAGRGARGLPGGLGCPGWGIPGAAGRRLLDGLHKPLILSF